MQDIDNDVKRNGSGYVDPTAYEAIKHIMSEDLESERFRKLLSAVFNICELSDFHLEGRLVVRDKRTGKVWR